MAEPKGPEKKKGEESAREAARSDFDLIRRAEQERQEKSAGGSELPARNEPPAD